MATPDGGGPLDSAKIVSADDMELFCRDAYRGATACSAAECAI
jgi:hypothetical protein